MSKKNQKISSNCVFTRNYDESEKNYKELINKYTTLDPTLPRVTNIKCPNDECITNTQPKHNKEVVYIKYDQQKMKFIYICCFCKIAWKNNGTGTDEDNIERINYLQEGSE